MRDDSRPVGQLSTRRELAASLALLRPGSPARAPILTHMTAIDVELTGRAALRPGQQLGLSSP